MKDITNANEIRYYAKFLVHNEKDYCWELRFINSGGVKIGIFDDLETLICTAEQMSGTYDVYIGLNPRPRTLFERDKSPNSLRFGSTVKNDDIPYRIRFFLDIDSSVRPKGQNATEKELADTRELAERISNELKTRNIPHIIICSGNGYQITIPTVRYPTDKEHNDKYKLLLEWFAKNYDNDLAHVDLAVTDPARIVRCPETLNIKGPHTSSRPRRFAIIVDKYRLDNDPVDIFEIYSNEINSQNNVKYECSSEGKECFASINGDLRTLDIVSLFKSANHYRRPLSGSNGKHSVTCPWEYQHTTGNGGDTSTVIWESDNYKWPTFHCSHEHCDGKDLSSVIEFFGPEIINRFCGEHWLRASTDKTDKTDRWPEIIPIGLTYYPREIPKDAVPEKLFEIVQHISETVQVPLELPLSAVLSVLATAIGKRAGIKLPTHNEPSPIWTLCILPPGARKSQVFRLITTPITDAELKLYEEWKEEHLKWKNEADVAEETIKFCKKKLQKDITDDEKKELLKKMSEARLVIESEPICPHLWTQDTTSEALQALVAENGSIGVFSAEAGSVLESFGRYSGAKATDMGIWLAGHAGDPGKLNRVGKSCSNSQQLISLCFAAQPDALKVIGSNRLAKGRGFLARIAYFIPHDNRGSRSYKNIERTSDLILAKWNHIITKILSLPIKEIPAYVELNNGAESLWIEFAEEIEKRQRYGGDLRMLSGWASKLAGLAGRISLAYHMCIEGTTDQKINEDTMSRAIIMCRSLIEHVKAAITLMGEDETTVNARNILEKITSKRIEVISPREVAHSGWSGCKKTDEAKRALDLLAEHGYLRARIPDKNSKYGRPRSVVYDVNPDLSVSTVLSHETTIETDKSNNHNRSPYDTS